jgi:hypothetical protein
VSGDGPFSTVPKRQLLGDAAIGRGMRLESKKGLTDAGQRTDLV